jgi:hypothetical protein
MVVTPVTQSPTALKLASVQDGVAPKLRLTSGCSATFCSFQGGRALKIHSTVSAGRFEKERCDDW